MEALYRDRYKGFTAKHFHEHLVKHHGFRRDYAWTKTFWHARGLLAKAERRGRTGACDRGDRCRR